MSPRAGATRRSLAHKVLLGQGPDGGKPRQQVRVRVDQVALSRHPEQAIALAREQGLVRAAVDCAIAYESRCARASDRPGGSRPRHGPRRLETATSLGLSVARAGHGFPSVVHLERFAGPARLLLTDDARFAACAGVSTLSWVAGPQALAEALWTGFATLALPRSLQVQLSGRTQACVSIQDVALHLERAGLGQAVRELEQRHHAPVVLEFAGSAVARMNVAERALLASITERVGAASALFPCDERTVDFLREQRRSKSLRSLVPEAGAHHDALFAMELSQVDPLIRDAAGTIHPLRELEGQPVSQVLLGGDSPAALRELLSLAPLLRSKRVHADVELLVSAPTRPALEALGRSGALADLTRTGARWLEPERGLLDGEAYPPACHGIALSTFADEPGADGTYLRHLASPLTAVHAVASACLRPPLQAKRSARIAMPRELMTEDALLLKAAASPTPPCRIEQVSPPPHASLCRAWERETPLSVCRPREARGGAAALVIVHSSAEERWLSRHASELGDSLRVVVGVELGLSRVARMADCGLVVCACDGTTLESLQKAPRVVLPPLETVDENDVLFLLGGQRLALRWLARCAPRLGASLTPSVSKARLGTPGAVRHDSETHDHALTVELASS